MEHGRQRFLPYDVTAHPSSEWVVQQLREAFPETASYCYGVFDYDSELSVVVTNQRLFPARLLDCDVQVASNIMSASVGLLKS